LISWFPNFFFIDFLDELELFIGEKQIFTKKKVRHSAVCCGCPHDGCPHENFVHPIFERSFQVRHFYFWITKGIGLTGVYLYSWLQEQIPSGSSHTNFWLLFHFHEKNLPILIFLGLIWCKILCWAQKSILYWVWNATGSHESPKTKFVSHEILSRTQKSIRYGVWNATTNHESPKIWTNFNFWNNKDYWHVFKALFSIIWVYSCSHIFFLNLCRCWFFLSLPKLI
jgi:hypothetical protein